MALCKYPFYQGENTFFGCGQCHICRINKRREWTARLMLESTIHEHKAFVTLTYNDQNLPEGGELVPQDLTKYLKRLRKRLKSQNRNFRYFGCGEYGEKKGRPHFHIILYGVAETETDLLSKTWGKGNIFVGSVTKDSMQYVCGYVLKKNLKTDNGEKKQNEFSRMSLKPGIGADVVERIAKSMIRQNKYTLEMQLGGDSPGQLRINGKLWPIGRYLRNKLRKELGINEEEAKAINKTLSRIATQKKIEEVETSPEYKTEVMRINKARDARQMDSYEATRAKIILYNRSKVASSESLARIYEKERTLDNA